MSLSRDGEEPSLGRATKQPFKARRLPAGLVARPAALVARELTFEATDPNAHPDHRIANREVGGQRRRSICPPVNSGRPYTGGFPSQCERHHSTCAQYVSLQLS